MDKQKLNQIYYISKEIKMWEDALRRLHGNSLVPSSEITGMPFAPPGNNSDKVGNLAANLVDIKAKIEELQRKRLNEYNDMIIYINSIEDSSIRQIVYYRHFACMNWTQVARKIGGNNTPDSVRKAHDRFLTKIKDEYVEKTV